MKKIKILAIVGSLRKASYNLQLAQIAKELVGDRAEFEILDYTDVPFFNEDIEFPTPDSVKRVREKVKEADGIWFFTPEYNHYFPGVLKNLTDWLSRQVSETEPPVLLGKPAAYSGASPSSNGTSLAQDHLVTMLSFINMDLMNAPRLIIPSVYNQADENGKLELKDSKKYLEKQIDAFIEFVQKRI